MPPASHTYPMLSSALLAPEHMLSPATAGPHVTLSSTTARPMPALSTTHGTLEPISSAIMGPCANSILCVGAEEAGASCLAES